MKDIKIVLVNHVDQVLVNALEIKNAKLDERRAKEYGDPMKKLNKYKKFFENPDCIDKIGELEKYIIDLKGYTFDL